MQIINSYKIRKLRNEVEYKFIYFLSVSLVSVAKTLCKFALTEGNLYKVCEATWNKSYSRAKCYYKPIFDLANSNYYELEFEYLPMEDYIIYLGTVGDCCKVLWNNKIVYISYFSKFTEIKEET